MGKIEEKNFGFFFRIQLDKILKRIEFDVSKFCQRKFQDEEIILSKKSFPPEIKKYSLENKSHVSERRVEPIFFFAFLLKKDKQTSSHRKSHFQEYYCQDSKQKILNKFY